MTAVDAPRTPLTLRARTGGTVAFRLEEVAGRRVMMVEVGGENRGALRSEDGENLAIAARTARQQRIPLVCFVASSGADLSEGVAAIHGWGIAADSLPDCLEITRRNLNDDCVEGLHHKELPIFSIQCHPEASPGPHDSNHLFGYFTELMEKHAS